MHLSAPPWPRDMHRVATIICTDSPRQRSSVVPPGARAVVPFAPTLANGLVVQVILELCRPTSVRMLLKICMAKLCRPKPAPADQRSPIKCLRLVLQSRLAASCQGSSAAPGLSVQGPPSASSSVCFAPSCGRPGFPQTARSACGCARVSVCVSGAPGMGRSCVVLGSVQPSWPSRICREGVEWLSAGGPC